MSNTPLSSPNIELCCKLCDCTFSSYSDFNRHHLRHVRQPRVTVRRLRPALLHLLNKNISISYLVKCWRERPQPCIFPSLDLLIVRRHGEEFVLVRKRGYRSSRRDRESIDSIKELTDSDRDSTDSDGESSTEGEEDGTWTELPTEEMQEDTSERLDSRAPISRKGKAGTRGVSKSKPASPQTGEKDNFSQRSSGKIPKGSFLERLRCIEGLSSPTYQMDSSSEDNSFDSANEPRPSTSGVVFPTQHKPLDLSDWKTTSDEDSDTEQKVFTKHQLYQTLLGSDYNIDEEEEEETQPQLPKIVIREPYVKLERIDQEPQTSEITPTQTPRRGTRCRKPSLSSSGGGTPAKRMAVESANTDEANENASSTAQRKRKPRAKCSNRGRKKRGTPQKANKRNSKSKPNEEREETPEGVMEELESTSETSADQTVNREDTGTNTEEPPQMPSTSTGAPMQMDLSGKQPVGLIRLDSPIPYIIHLSNDFYLAYSSAQSNHMPINWEAIGGTVIQTWNLSSASGLLTAKPCVQTTPQAANNNANSGKESAAGSTLISPNPKGQDEKIPSFGTVTARAPESFAENTKFVAEADEVRQSFCESLTGDNRDARRGPQQPIEQAVHAALWASLQRAPTTNQNGNNQDAALGHNNQMPNSQAINVSFLQNLLAERQVQHGPIPAENPEFVSLERLAQHQPPRFDMNSSEIATPMEQLTQQVNRLSNPTPQVNMISHMQPPPPLHAAGVPLPHPSTSFDGLGRMQPPMGPPPLFQGFNIFPNPAFQQQSSSPQLIPRPPALQQCPQIQAGAYQNQSLAQPQQTRSRARAAKRSLPKPAPTAESVPPKTRRSQSATKEKPQAAKAKAKASPKPSTSGNKAPAKRSTMDPRTVASVLAARGITVTPSTSRPANAVQAVKKTNVKTCSSSPVLNISSAITITPSSQKKGGSGKKKNDIPPAGITTTAKAPATALATASSSSLKSAAVMGQWRNCKPLSIINHNGGRHKECITIDLTADDELDISLPGPSVNRFLCNECGQKFPTAASLELHKETHRAPEPTFRCEPCNIQFSTAEALEEHRNDTHKYRGRANNWVIPIVDLDFPGAEDRLIEHGVTNFIPVSLGEGIEGNFAIPIISPETPRGPHSFLGVSNVIFLGQMRSLFGPRDN